ncbi:MAG: PAS domain S-box protein [Gammaproteobacteria bacterium]|nr:PAS domain S-box protein [Gammaproteobacteria bacterium]
MQGTDLPAFIDALPVGVLIVDGDGAIRLANTQLLAMFGYEHNALTGQPVEMLVPDALRPGHCGMRTGFAHAPQQRPMGGGKPLHARRHDGTLFPVEIGLAPLDSKLGPMVMATVVDISQRDRLQGELSALIDSTPMGIAVIDAAGRITRMNHRGAAMFGYDVEELIGKPLELLIPERHRPAHEGYRTDYLANPEPRFMGKGRDLTGLHHDGTEFPVEVGLNLFGDGAARAVVTTINDITDRKYAEQALRQANADLDEFTYVASHDLKSPVRGIGSLLEWIEEDLGDDIPPDVRHNLDRARIRVDRMQQLIDDLLIYSRAGRVRDAFEDTDLDALFDEILETVAPPDGFSVCRELDVSRVQTAKTPLATVLRNLVSNAIKHHDREHGEVVLRVRRHGAYLVFEVCDDGPGVPPSAHDRICKLFQTLSSSTDQPRSGIGLAVSKRLVQTHGGTLEIDSRENERGSIFRFTWPLVKRKDLHDQAD